MEEKFKPRYYLIYLSTLLGPLSTNSLIPLFEDLRINFGLNAIAYVSLAITIYILPFAILQLFAGTFSDIVDKKKVVIFGFLVFIMGLFFNLISVVQKNYILFLFAFLIQGIGFAFINPTILALIGIIAPEEKKGFLMGLYNSSAGLGITIGGILSGFFANTLREWRLLFLLNPLIGILALVVFMYALRNCPIAVCRPFDMDKINGLKEKSLSSKFRATFHQLKKGLNKRIILLGIFGFFCFFTMITLVSTLNEQIRISLPILNDQEVIGNVSIILTITGISSILLSPLTGWMLKKVSSFIMLFIGGILMLCILFIPMGRTIIDFMIICFIVYLGSIFIWPALFKEAINLNPEARGTSSAIINSLNFTGYALVGPFYLYLGIPMIYILVFSFDIITIAITIILSKMKYVN